MQLFTWSFRYVATNNKVILAEVDFNQEGVVEGWCAIDECDRKEAVKEASGFLPINVDDMVVPCYVWANHPEIKEGVCEAYEEVLMQELEQEEELYKRAVRLQAMSWATVDKVLLSQSASVPAVSTPAVSTPVVSAPTLSEFKVCNEPNLAAKPAAKDITPLIQKWVEKHQESQDLSGILELKTVKPNAFSGVLDRLINGVVHSFTYEQKEDKLNKAERTSPKATRARGNNSKPKGKRPWRDHC